MLKDTHRTLKSVPKNPHLFDKEQVKLALLQRDYPADYQHCYRELCPALFAARLAVKRHEAEAKRQAELDAQRKRRQDARELSVDAARIAAPWVVAGEGASAVAVPVLDRRESLGSGELVSDADFFTHQAAPAPAPARSAKVKWLLQELAEASAEPEKRSKRARSRRELSDELNVHTIEVTPPLFDPFKKLEKLRQQCREVGKLLIARDNIQKTLFKAGSKILNCSLWGLFQSVNPEVNYRVGTALCKCRLCPNCQRVLAARRKTAFLAWFELNRDQLRKYFFYHMVLTVRHKAATGERTGLYTPDMLRYFAELRGSHKGLSGSEQRSRSQSWRHFVDGGSYSVEIAPGRDGTAHIHIHVLLFGNVQLFNRAGVKDPAKRSAFLKYVEPLWKEITGNDDPKNSGVYLEPVYYTDPETKKPVYAFKGSQARVEDAVSECVKYTMKADAQALTAYSNDFLEGLLTMRNRYYSRFGCLHPKDKQSSQFKKLDMLAQDYQDLEQVTRDELARLFDPTTGELVEKEDTWFLATPLRHMVPHEAESAPEALGMVYDQAPAELAPVAVYGEQAGQRVELGRAERQRSIGGQDYYSIKSLTPKHLQVWFPYLERQRAAIALSRSIGADYDRQLDFAAPAPEPGLKRQRTDQGEGQNNFQYPVERNAFRKRPKKHITP